MSIKALEIAEEKQAVAQYGSSDSGASLGDIFKAAIKKRENAEGEGGEEPEPTAAGIVRTTTLRPARRGAQPAGRVRIRVSRPCLTLDATFGERAP